MPFGLCRWEIDSCYNSCGNNVRWYSNCCTPRWCQIQGNIFCFFWCVLIQKYWLELVFMRLHSEQWVPFSAVGQLYAKWLPTHYWQLTNSVKSTKNWPKTESKKHPTLYFIYFNFQSFCGYKYCKLCSCCWWLLLALMQTKQWVHHWEFSSVPYMEVTTPDCTV